MANETKQAVDHIYNYCVCFLDLLGQREALKGQGLVPRFSTPEEEREFADKVLRSSIGAIYGLQRRAEEILRTAHDAQRSTDSPLRASLEPAQQLEWDQMFTTEVQTQRWSDGLVLFSSLGNERVKCHVNEVFDMITLAGALSMFALASRHPIRGAIEIAWATELNPGEITGAAVARAYELESEVAGYPRVVLGPLAVAYLKGHAVGGAQDTFSRNDRALAELCLSMLAIDEDGMAIVDYLGAAYRNAVGEPWSDALYARALHFVEGELTRFRRAGNTKLAFRYVQLRRYFLAHPVTSDEESAPTSPLENLAAQ